MSTSDPQIISVRCPKCDRLWDYLYDEYTGPPPPPEVKCSICEYKEHTETVSVMQDLPPQSIGCEKCYSKPDIAQLKIGSNKLGWSTIVVLACKEHLDHLRELLLKYEHSEMKDFPGPGGTW